MKTIGSALMKCYKVNRAENVHDISNSILGKNAVYSMNDWKGTTIIFAGEVFKHENVKRLFESTIDQVWVVEWCDVDTKSIMDERQPSFELYISSAIMSDENSVTRDRHVRLYKALEKYHNKEKK